MATSLPLHHGAMLLKYSGISFISGAINHGFFSGERSLWTAAIGMGLFVAGAVMEHRLSDNPDEAPAGLMKTLAWGALLSIGLGFFTGGLQHFPDSPARSAWVVPLGFFISVLALAMNGPFAWRRSSTVYTLLAGVLVASASGGAWQWLERNPSLTASHAQGDAQGEAPDTAGTVQATAWPEGLAAWKVDRLVEIHMSDAMRFTPDTLQVKAGETVRLRVHNDGKLAHEWVLGSDEEIRVHAQAMKDGAAHGHEAASGPAALQVAPGQTGELVIRFGQAARLQMACLIPGHYEAGMRGTVQVNPVAPGGAPDAAEASHAQGTHKH